MTARKGVEDGEANAGTEGRERREGISGGRCVGL